MVPEDWGCVGPDRPMDLSCARMDFLDLYYYCFRSTTGTVAHVQSVHLLPLFIFGYFILVLILVLRFSHSINTGSSTNTGFQQPMAKPSSKSTRRGKPLSKSNPKPPAKSKPRAKSPNASTHSDDEMVGAVTTDPPAVPSNGYGVVGVSREVPRSVRELTQCLQVGSGADQLTEDSTDIQAAPAADVPVPEDPPTTSDKAAAPVARKRVTRSANAPTAKNPDIQEAEAPTDSVNNSMYLFFVVSILLTFGNFD